jgi:ATP-binding cassette subfamily C protein CydC
MTPGSPQSIASILRHAASEHRRSLRRAAAAGFAVAAATVLLLGLSGWFLTAAALAAVMGSAHVFNYMLPAVAIRLLAIVRTGARYGERLTGHDAALGMMARVRPVLFRAIAIARPARTFGFSTGEASARLVQDVSVIEAAVVRRSAPWSLLGAMGSAGALTLLGGWGPVVSVGVTVLATVALAAVVARAMARPARAVLLANGTLKDIVGLYGSAAAELRCYDLEDRAGADVAQAGAVLAKGQLGGVDAASWLDLLQSVALALAAAVAFLLAMPSGAPIAALAGLAAAMAVDGAAPFLRDLAQRASVAVATDRLDEILRQPADGHCPSQNDVPQALDLSFAAFGWQTFGRGDRVALVGKSGCGKTSLIETLLGLREGARGAIRIGGVDGVDIAPDRLRTICALSPQDAHLIAGTVRDNLLLADPAADDARLWAALHDAALDDRVAALALGLDTWIGENGACLSGGERRRLSLARALLARAPWLLLDEPTEGLDPATEEAVLARVSARLDATGQGALIVTHSARVLHACNLVADMTPVDAARSLEAA